MRIRNPFHLTVAAVAAAGFLVVLVPRGAGQEIVIQKEYGPLGFRQPIPIWLQGFSSRVTSILKFDLTFMGFTNEPSDQAQYLVQGKQSGGRIEARVIDRISKAQVLARAYVDAPQRVEAHALADDLAEKITQHPGIARTKIVFKVDQGRSSEIYISDFDGHNAVAVTADRSIVAAPCWVPGHQAIYYTSYKLGNPDIYWQDLASGRRRVFARFSGLNTSAAVSPDGKRVAMILSKGGSPDLYVCNADGTGLKQLTRTRGLESSPCWSPDGRTICFVSNHRGPGLYLISADGGRTRRLRTDGIANPREPDWSPDGKWIAFTAQMGEFDVCVVPAKGGAATVLVSGMHPSWAPNSRALVFTRLIHWKKVLSLLDVPTKQVKDIHPVPGDCSQADWAK